jgi:hypothetical protein
LRSVSGPAAGGRLWQQSCEAAGLERPTLEQYRQNLDHHIIPILGTVKLSRLTVPMARAFEDKLARDCSPATVRKVRSSLSSILTDAQERGLVGENVVRSFRAGRRRGKETRRVGGNASWQASRPLLKMAEVSEPTPGRRRRSRCIVGKCTGADERLACYLNSDFSAAASSALSSPRGKR